MGRPTSSSYHKSSFGHLVLRVKRSDSVFRLVAAALAVRARMRRCHQRRGALAPAAATETCDSDICRRRRTSRGAARPGSRCRLFAVLVFGSIRSAGAATLCSTDSSYCDGTYTGTSIEHNYVGMIGTIPTELGLLTDLIVL